jgi:hypothetical protein
MRMRLDQQEREDVCVVSAQPGYALWAKSGEEVFETGTIIAWAIDGEGSVTPITDVDGLERFGAGQLLFIKDPQGRFFIPFTTGYVKLEDIVSGEYA